MAKYADYVKNEETAGTAADQLEQEVKGTPASNMPEKFKGKTAEEIAQAYSELEKLNSRQAQDVGKYRKIADDLIALESLKSRQPASPPTKPVTVDDLYENADAHIRRVAREETSDKVAELERELQSAKFERRMAEFTTRYPDWGTQVKDPAFLNWVSENPYRVKLAQAADAGDLDAADVLFGLHKDLQGKQKQDTVRTRKREQDLQDATLESSGPVGSDMVEVYSRSDLLEKRIAAKQGDAKAERWLQTRADSIAIAYAEGRMVD